MYKYFPHTAADIKEMLDVCGMSSLDDLFADVPQSVVLKDGYDLPSAKSEIEIRKMFAAMGAKNKQLICFAGAGVYDKYCPAMVPQILSRSEIYTSYTPYHAKVSPVTLHNIIKSQPPL